MHMRLLTLYLTLAGAGALFTSILHAHDRPLDLYGCHLDEDRKFYHCHRGVYMGLSFDSKSQMVERLKLQHMALGRPWPYGNAIDNDEPQIISAQSGAKNALTANPKDERKPNRKLVSAEVKQSSPRGQSKEASNLTKSKNSQQSITNAKTETSNKLAQATVGEQQRSMPIRKRTEPELQVWIVKLEPDGRAIFENREGERFFLDEYGRKVVVSRRQS